MSDFFESQAGLARQLSLRNPLTWVRDALADARLVFSGRLQAAKRSPGPRKRVLIVGVEVPARVGRLAAIAGKMSASIHEIDVSIVRMKPQGKFANVDEAIAAAPRPLDQYDWLVITDDDVAFDRHFLDTYLRLASDADLAISQPAHRYASYASYQLTRRVYGSLVRSSRFIEIGPITVLARKTFAELVPFPDSRWCYGIDLLWSKIAQRNGWKMGVVDATPIRHLSPVAKTYDKSEAFVEGKALLARFGVDLARSDVLQSSPLLKA